MNAALFRKTAYDHRWTLAIVSVAVTIFPVLISHAFASIPWQMIHEMIEKVPWITGLFRALTGTEFPEVLSINMLGAFAYVHPVMLAVTWGYVIMAATRVICGEIDRGTADVIFALPVTRPTAYLSVSAWIFVTCPLLPLFMWLGVWIGSRTADLPATANLWELRYVVVNACAMLWAVAGIAMLFSAAGSHRGRTVGAIFAVLVASFLLNTLAALWPAADALSVVGLLHYFRPFVILSSGTYQTTDIAVLLTIAAFTWLTGALIFTRRDITT